MLPLCLILTADTDFSATFRRDFEGCGFKPYCVESLASALGVMRQWQFDAVLLDADTLGDAFSDALSSLSERAKAPVLVMLSSADEERHIEGLEAGAADSFVKPVSARLVAAKLRCLIEGAQQRRKKRTATVTLGALRLDPRRASASVGDQPLVLTAGEFELLLLLASRAGEFVHRDTIARTLGSPGGGEARRSADMHVCRIRRKLREAGVHCLQLETIYGRGYSLRLAPRPHDARLAERHPDWTA